MAAVCPGGLGVNRPHYASGHSQGRTQAHTHVHTPSTPTAHVSLSVCQLRKVGGDHISPPSSQGQRNPGLVPGRGDGPGSIPPTLRLGSPGGELPTPPGWLAETGHPKAVKTQTLAWEVGTEPSPPSGSGVVRQTAATCVHQPRAYSMSTSSCSHRGQGSLDITPR